MNSKSRLWSSLGLIVCNFTILVTNVSSLDASTFLGNTASGNDPVDQVTAVINQYNMDNMTGLTTDIELFKKTDDNKAFFDDPMNGFSFFDMAMGGNQLTVDELHMTDEAWFEYTGSEPLQYYSVKSAQFASVYQFWPGERNLLTVPNETNDISHVSVFVPEPTSCFLSMLGLLGVATARRSARRR